MNRLFLFCCAVFVLLSLSVCILFGFAARFQETRKVEMEKRQKKNTFKSQSKTRRRIHALLEKQQAVIAGGAIPGAVYLTLTLLAGAGGFLTGKVVFGSTYLSVFVGVLFLALPIVILSFSQNKNKSRSLNRLASSMMILSNSYIVTEDFITTVKDNLALLDYPEPFRDFLAYATMMDSDLRSALRRMGTKVDNAYFSQWVDSLVLAQDDRSLRFVAVSVVDSMLDALQAQEESDAYMYAVWREYIVTLILIFSVPLIFKLLMHDAYMTMTTSIVGQGLMTLLLLAVVFSVFKAIQINRPLMM